MEEAYIQTVSGYPWQRGFRFVAPVEAVGEHSTVAERHSSMLPGESRLLGRDAPLALIHTCLRRKPWKDAHTVLVHGAAGIGKTRLLKEAVSHADLQGPECLWISLVDAEQQAEMSMWRQITEAVARQMSPSELRTLVGWAPTWSIGSAPQDQLSLFCRLPSSLHLR